MVHNASREMLWPFRAQMGDAILLIHVQGAFLLFGTTTMASCQLWPGNSPFILLRASGHISGAHARIRRVHTKAAYVLRRAHVLDLCIVQAWKIQLVRSMDTIQSVSLAFKYSEKRVPAFEEQLGNTVAVREEMRRRGKLKIPRETRWVCCAHCLDVFVSWSERLKYRLINSAKST